MPLIYLSDDTDDEGLQHSPKLTPMKYTLVPSPSPPPAVPSPPPLSADSSPEPEGGRRPSMRSKPQPSLGDAVLIASMADGKHINIALDAGKKLLASELVEENIIAATRHSPDKAPEVELLKSPKSKIKPLGAESKSIEGAKTTTLPSIDSLYIKGPSSVLPLSWVPRRYYTNAPSSGRYPAYSNRRHFQGKVEPSRYRNLNENSSSNTASGESGSIPSTSAMNRINIENLTIAHIDGYYCKYEGCTIRPFKTQYLLNSHANVHSQDRPHYCSVKGCPRSEGGKGFKRRNEMIRHGLVHDSHSYVCPFCPSRRSKYRRPDNLQRHVRAHHWDKDKNDAQLRDVLSKPPEGHSRGRRS